MSGALQQQVFALDAKYNAHRVPQCSTFRTLYIRRRSQLLREADHSTEEWKQYLKLRSTLLQQRYGPVGGNKLDSASSTISNLSRTISRTSFNYDNLNTTAAIVSSNNERVIPTKEAEASRAMVGNTTISENYAFVGVHHIFDQHSAAVTMIKFANNERSRLCCSSLDGNLSICNVTSNPPSVEALLKGHAKAVTGFDWSIDNDLIASASLDGTIRVWRTSNQYLCLRVLKGTVNDEELLCCLFHPSNNNLIVVGNNKGELKIANVSTGRFMKNVCRIGGNILSLTSDTNGRLFWAGNNKGDIVSIFCEMNGSNLCKTKKINLSPTCSVTSLSYRAWISREARNPLLLVNSTNSSIYLFGITDTEGGLQMKRKFQNRHQKYMVQSTFCPIMSFRQGACVVTGSEDGSVYFVDIEKVGNKAVVNTLQGHASTVLSISFNYDESLLATSDLQGLVIIWKRDNNMNN